MKLILNDEGVLLKVITQIWGINVFYLHKESMAVTPLTTGEVCIVCCTCLFINPKIGLGR